MGKFYKTVMSEFYCTQCGKKGIPVYRKKGQERKAGHLKKLYCLYCNMETNHVEIKIMIIIIHIKIFEKNLKLVVLKKVNELIKKIYYIALNKIALSIKKDYVGMQIILIIVHID